MFKRRFVWYFKTESAQEKRLKDYWLHIKCRAKKGSEVVTEIRMAFVARQEEMNVHYDIIPATTHNNELGVSDNSKLTSISSEDPSFATDY